METSEALVLGTILQADVARVGHSPKLLPKLLSRNAARTGIFRKEVGNEVGKGYQNSVIIFIINYLVCIHGGESGIRTHGTVRVGL
jgi:hypothetical protein